MPRAIIKSLIRKATTGRIWEILNLIDKHHRKDLEDWIEAHRQKMGSDPERCDIPEPIDPDDKGY